MGELRVCGWDMGRGRRGRGRGRAGREGKERG